MRFIVMYAFICTLTCLYTDCNRCSCSEVNCYLILTDIVLLQCAYGTPITREIPRTSRHEKTLSQSNVGCARASIVVKSVGMGGNHWRETS